MAVLSTSHETLRLVRPYFSHFKFLFSYRWFIQNIPKVITINLVVFKKRFKNVKLLADDGRWTTYEDGRKPIAIGHLAA